MPILKSQSFSRSYGSILPTSFIYIKSIDKRQIKPQRPDAEIGTTSTRSLFSTTFPFHTHTILKSYIYFMVGLANIPLTKFSRADNNVRDTSSSNVFFGKLYVCLNPFSHRIDSRVRKRLIKKRGTLPRVIISVFGSVSRCREHLRIYIHTSVINPRRTLEF